MEKEPASVAECEDGVWTVPPVLFLIFNRPDLTARVFGRIREIRPPKLFIAADGPRRDREGEAELCEETRRMTESIDWECDVKRLYRDENLGCRIAVSSAISWLFQNEEKGIILEDDCLPDSSFFRFSAELLEKYADNPGIHSIGASNFQNGIKRGPGSYYFSKFPHIWGWATWRRAWADYDVDISFWPAASGKIKKYTGNDIAYHGFTRQFNQVKCGKVDTWDYQFVCLGLYKGRINILPQKNLVTNIGFDARATHTISVDDPFANLMVTRMSFPLDHPSNAIFHRDADQFTVEHVFQMKNRRPGGLKGLFRRIQRSIRKRVSGCY